MSSKLQAPAVTAMPPPAKGAAPAQAGVLCTDGASDALNNKNDEISYH